MSSTPDEIQDFIEDLEKTQEAIKEQIIDICFFMKGGIQYEDAWGLSCLDRERIIIRINKWNKEMSSDSTDYL